MELPPRRSPDNESPGPEDEQFDRSVIDETGMVEQEEALSDAIYDAIGEAEEGDGIVPEWGARTLARALADERDDPYSGALHHYAVTGRADREDMLSELTRFTDPLYDEDTREWAAWLEAYVRHLPEEPDNR
ncbi:MAG TPA: hypothetical protein VFU43_04095 [Streptosporangiaceae bacterium]|nr:hypothetical protein [Streptosporangiaceae bacterium]